MPSSDLKFDMPISGLTKHITVHATIVGWKGWLVRLQIAMFFIKLGARIAGLGVEVEVSDDNGR